MYRHIWFCKLFKTVIDFVAIEWSIRLQQNKSSVDTLHLCQSISISTGCCISGANIDKPLLQVILYHVEFTHPIIFLMFFQAYRQKMYGPRYVWMLTGGYSHRWWTKPVNGNCTREQLATAIDGYFSVESLNKIIGSRTSISGLVSFQFVSAFSFL